VAWVNRITIAPALSRPFTLPSRICMYPKNRIDALTDGIFAVAMTLLVFNLKIADDLHITNEAALIKTLRDLSSSLFPYLMSFYLLGLNWLSLVKTRSNSDVVSRAYTKWWLIYLLLITCLPFSTLLIGRFAAYTVSDTLYALNIACVALTGLRLMSQLDQPVYDNHWQERKISLWCLVFSASLTIALSFFIPGNALFAMLLSLFPPLILRRLKK
jgi:uncharacterized membrane protein